MIGEKKVVNLFEWLGRKVFRRDVEIKKNLFQKVKEERYFDDSDDFVYDYSKIENQIEVFNTPRAEEPHESSYELKVVEKDLIYDSVKSIIKDSIPSSISSVFTDERSVSADVKIRIENNGEPLPDIKWIQRSRFLDMQPNFYGIEELTSADSDRDIYDMYILPVKAEGDIDFDNKEVSSIKPKLSTISDEEIDNALSTFQIAVQEANTEHMRSLYKMYRMSYKKVLEDKFGYESKCYYCEEADVNCVLDNRYEPICSSCIMDIYGISASLYMTGVCDVLYPRSILESYAVKNLVQDGNINVPKDKNLEIREHAQELISDDIEIFESMSRNLRRQDVYDSENDGYIN